MPKITDWIVAICTVVYVIATIIIMCANRKAASLSEKQIQEGKRQFEKQQRLSIRPYLNLYVARDGEHIEEKEHYSIILEENLDTGCKNIRYFSIRNIGNGSAKDIKIYITKQGDTDLRKKLSVRNGFLLVNKQYVYDVYYDNFMNISLCCNYTDLYDNRYQQEMEIYYDAEQGDIISHTYNPIFLDD